MRGRLSSRLPRVSLLASFGFPAWHRSFFHAHTLLLSSCPLAPLHPAAKLLNGLAVLMGHFSLPTSHSCTCSKPDSAPPLLRDCHSPDSTEPKGPSEFSPCFMRPVSLTKRRPPVSLKGFALGIPRSSYFGVSPFLSGFPVFFIWSLRTWFLGAESEGLFSSPSTISGGSQSRPCTDFPQVCTSSPGSSPDLPEPPTHLSCRRLSFLPRNLQTEMFSLHLANSFLTFSK